MTRVTRCFFLGGEIKTDVTDQITIEFYSPFRLMANEATMSFHLKYNPLAIDSTFDILTFICAKAIFI